MKTLQELRQAVDSKTATPLTDIDAEQLKGKKIATIYFGYNGQDGIDEFVVGDVKPEVYADGREGHLCLFTAEGRNTFMRLHKQNNGFFSCSDVDRFVYFVEVEN